MSSYNPNLKPYRTHDEIDALNKVIVESDYEEGKKRARVIIEMSKGNADGQPCSYDDRIKHTKGALGVSKNYIEKCLRLYNAAGINGILRIDDTLKPDILDRKEDAVPTPVRHSEELDASIKNLNDLNKSLIKQVAFLNNCNEEDVEKIWETMQSLGAYIDTSNPSRLYHLFGKEERHAEIAGFYLGYKYGIFAIASKNVSAANDEVFTMRKVFYDTKRCNDSVGALMPLFEENKTSGCVITPDVFFANLIRVYPPELGWNVHCFVYKEDAASDENGDPIIEGLPCVDGYSYEKTWNLCDFSSPFKAAFNLLYFRDQTNVQGWKVRDKVVSIIRGMHSASNAPVFFIGAQETVIDSNHAYVEMSSRIHLPNAGTIVLNSRCQLNVSLDGLSSSEIDDFEVALSDLDYHISDMTRELAGNMFQGTVNAIQAYASSGDDILFMPVIIEAESGRRQIWLSKSLAQNYGLKKMLYTINMKNLIEMTSTTQSFREASSFVSLLLHRKPYENISYTSLQDLLTQEGIHIQECLEKECEEGLQMYNVIIENGCVDYSQMPEGVIHLEAEEDGTLHYDLERIKRKLERWNKGKEVPLTLEEVIETLNTMEKDPQKAVYVFFDGVVVKKQKENRKSSQDGDQSSNAQGNQGMGNGQAGTEGKDADGKTSGKKRGRKKKTENEAEQTVINPTQEKKRIEIHNVYILYQDKAYVITAPTMDLACRYALGFLLKKGLLEENELVFFSDGANVIKDAIKRYFPFTKYHLYLDWYHVHQKLYQFFTQFLKGGKARLQANEELRKQFFDLLWEGDVEGCKKFIEELDPSIIKNPKSKDDILGYLERKKEHLYNYGIRKLVGLVNSSNRVEQVNYFLVSKRQKKNGMAWCPIGSQSLAYVTMLFQNHIEESWWRTKTISFEMYQTTVSRIYTADVA